MIEVEGPVAFIGNQTRDNRIVGTLSWRELPLPILAEGTLDLVGEIWAVDVRPDGVVWATGKLMEAYAPKPDESVFVGADLAGGRAVHTVNVRVGEVTFGDPDLVETCVDCRLAGVTLLQRPGAWPETHLRRKD